MHNQYSSWQNPYTTPIDMWQVIMKLFLIDSSEKLQSKMDYTYYFYQMDVTNSIQLGEAFSQQVMGSTPASIIDSLPMGTLAIQPIIPDQNFIQLLDTKASAAADNVLNWRT